MANHYRHISTFRLFNILLLSWIFPLFAFAQQPFYYNIGTEQDLPSSEVYQIKQDSFGYIWIGCDAGLFRYDGFRFKQYVNSQMTGRSISDLQLDPFGKIWCKNFNGQILKVVGDTLQIAVDYSKKCGSSPFYAFSPDGRLWAACLSSISVYDKNLNLIKEIDLSSTKVFADRDISEIAFFQQKIYCARAGIGFLGIDINTYKQQTVHVDTAASNYLKKDFRTLFSISKNACFVLTEFLEQGRRYTKIHLLHKDSLQYQRQLINGSQNHILYRHKADQNNNMWICTSVGAMFMHNIGAGDTISKQHSILPEQRISDMIQDREGNYWFTTLQGGIFVVPSLSVLRYAPENVAELKIPHLTRLHASPYDNSVWIGAYNGQVMKFDPKNRKLQSCYDGLHFPYRAVKSFFEDDHYMIISRNNNSCIVKTKNNDTTFVRVGDARGVLIHNDTIFSVLPNKFNKSYSVHKHLLSREKFDTVFTITPIGGWSLAYDSLSQSIWVTLSSGVHCYKNGILSPVLHEGKPIYGGFLDYAYGVIWISGLNSGVYGFEKGILKYHYTTRNGLRNNSTKAIEAVDDYVWVTAANFLHRIHIKKGKVDIFTKNLGIYAKDIEDIEILNDTVYLATHKGLIQFPVHLEADNPIAPNIVIESVFLANEAIGSKELKALPYRHGQLRIYFSATAFRSRGGFRYEYRLQGLDSMWTSLSANNNYASFSAIPPGTYRFEVRAVNESGLASPVIAGLDLHVLTPIWQQWWFFLLLSLAFVAMVFGVYHIRMGIVTKRLQLEQQLSTSQLTALKAQMNPHFMYNALNSIQELILTNDVRNANLYLNKFSTLMRRILKASDNDAILLDEEIAILQLYLDLEKLRFGNDFTYEVTVDAALPKEQLLIASMVIQPFVENAIKHGLLHKKGDKKLEISFVLENEKLLCCTITDNGIGRKRAGEIQERSKMQHQSFATKATEKRLEILNRSYKLEKIGLEIEDIYDEEGEKALGTKVFLHIPYTIVHHS